MNLTPHFTLEELIASDTADQMGIDNVPSETEIYRLAQLAGKLEDIRSLLGGFPLLVSSGFRCQALNTAIGGATTSAHLYGCAVDFTVPQFGNPYKICSYLTELEGFLYDQLINEEGSGARWVHIGLAVGADAPHCCQGSHDRLEGVTQNGFYPV